MKLCNNVKRKYNLKDVWKKLLETLNDEAIIKLLRDYARVQ